MKQITWIIIIIILSLYVLGIGNPGNTGTDDATSTNSYPTDFSGSGDGTGGSASVPPPNPIIINGVQIKDYRGLSASGNSIKFSSATYAKSSSFSFNDIINANLNVNNGKLSYAQVTSNKDNNVLSINNPYSPS